MTLRTGGRAIVAAAGGRCLARPSISPSAPQGFWPDNGERACCLHLTVERAISTPRHGAA